MPNDFLFWFLAIVATLLVGAGKGGLPLVGMLTVPVLSLSISPVAAAGLMLPLYILSDMYGLWLYRKKYDLRNLKILVPASAIGIAVGWALASHTNDDIVLVLVGLIGLFYCIDTLLKSRRKLEPRPADVPRGIFWGSLTGFTSFVSHAGAPPFQMYVLPQKLEKMVYAGTSTIAFAIINLLKLPPYWFLGQVNVSSLKTCLVLAPLALFGAWAGYKMTTLLPEKLFFRIVEVALFLVSLKLLYDGVRGLI